MNKLTNSSEKSSESPLIRKAREIFNQFPTNGLAPLGFRRGRDINFPGHIIVVYPPFQTLDSISQEHVFSKDNPKEKDREVTIYVHLPFCTGKCKYCHYVTFPNCSEKAINLYLSALKKEFKLTKKFPELQELKVHSIYFGGGTPTYLSEKQLRDIITFFKNNFNIQEEIEISIEAAPETIIGESGREKLSTLQKLGVNRLNIGMQCFDDSLLQEFGRRHTTENSIEAYKNAVKAGFENINVDMLYAMADQKLQDVEADLQTLELLMPTSITAYAVRIKETTKGFGTFMNEPKRFQNEDEICVMNIMYIEKLKELGYKQNPAGWFVRDKPFEYKQQLFKWRNNEMLAFGVSSYAYMNNCQYYNSNDLEHYYEAIKNGRLPIWRGKKLNKRGQMCREMVFGMKHAEGVNKKKFKQKFGIWLEEAFGDTTIQLEKLGLVENDKDAIKLTYKGVLFPGKVSKCFYSEEVKEQINSIPRLIYSH